jgi:tetratricopeptide (TPR) repeat protein
MTTLGTKSSVCAIILCLSQVVHAQATEADGTDQDRKEEASQAFWRGKEYYDSGQWTAAEEQFEKAYLLTKNPDLLYNLGQTYRRAGDCARALDAYDKFAQVAPSSRLAAQAEEQAAALRSSCAALTVQPQSDEVARDTPTPAPPPPVTISVPPGTGAPSQPHRASAFEARRPRLGVWSVAAFTAGVAAVGTAGGLWWWNQQRYASWTERDRALAQGAAPGEAGSGWLARQASNDRLASSIQGADRAAVALGVGGVLLLSASAILYFTAPSASSEARLPREARPHVSCEPVLFASRSAGMMVSGAF